MKKAYVFPGQGAQFPGMAKEVYEKSQKAKEMFEKANEILGFRITDINVRRNTGSIESHKGDSACDIPPLSCTYSML